MGTSLTRSERRLFFEVAKTFGEGPKREPNKPRVGLFQEAHPRFGRRLNVATAFRILVIYCLFVATEFGSGGGAIAAKSVGTGGFAASGGTAGIPPFPCFD